MTRAACLSLALAGLVGMAGCARETQVRGADDAVATSQDRVVEPVRGRVPAGTQVWVTLDETLDADEHRAGDRFTAHVAQDHVSPDGEVLIPQGARVTGRIVGLEKSDRSGEPAVIRLALERIRLAGVEERLDAQIVETDLAVKKRREISKRDVAIGAAAGAVLGGVMKGFKGAIVGGILGAAAGTAISLGTGDVEPELPAGTNLSVRLQQPVRSVALIQGRYRRY